MKKGEPALSAMLWKFFKTNWFSIALVLLALLAIGRSNNRFRFWSNPSPAAVGKYTDAAPGAPAHLNLFDDGDAPTVIMPAIEEAKAVTFLKRFGNVAANEKKKFGLPPSILLACAYVNSHAGQRNTAVQANNYFALPCSDDWSGARITLDGRCFRHHDTAWASFRDFGSYLSQQPWFDEARRSAGADWQRWLKVLADKDISDVEGHLDEMRSVIEQYRLFELDGR